MTKLPQGWVATPIGEICALKNGRAFKPSDWSTTGVPIVRIQNLNNFDASFNYFKGQIEDRFRLRGGELLFAWSGTPGTSFGAHVWRGNDAVLNQHIFRVDFDEVTIDKRFFRFAINQKLDELIGIAHGGAGLQHVTKGKFENTEVRLPPLPEQKRIADKLDTVLARLDSTRARLDRIPALLKRFRQSVLAAATSGALTEEWRDGVETEWQEFQLADICLPNRVITYGVIKLGDEIPNGVPCLRTSNVRWLRVELNGIKKIRKSLSEEYGRTILRGGEVLVNVRGTLGGVSAVDKSMAGWNVSREVAVVPADKSKVDANWLALHIASNSSQKWLTSVEKGVAYTGINIEDLRTLPVRLPSLLEQHEIVRRVESLFAIADRIQKQYEAAKAKIDKLAPALLAKAFRGELVPQDPNDEPASVMLERLRASKDATAKPVKKRQKVKEK